MKKMVQGVKNIIIMFLCCVVASAGDKWRVVEWVMKGGDDTT